MELDMSDRDNMDTTTLDICVDCLFYLASGEVTDGEGNDITADHRAQIAAVWGEDFDITLGAGESDEEREPWFSWSSCDGCGSTLGGNREHATAWTRKTCSDCGC